MDAVDLATVVMGWVKPGEAAIVLSAHTNASAVREVRVMCPTSNKLAFDQKDFR
ncbi:hypothetical protein ABI_29660 [Asticcacaulis biprosthecium C19]|uniref:Uncharacterized protein n=1 Tax=Asticcacaulis biprosthecium C19 TaxID=715226 RepID=F4QMV7_9CAUL|nr:hypothetical protein ABI_29660 [Asticcacaulis biprosthecium C19]